METFKYIEEDDYITIPASLRKRGLKSGELIIAAIIFRYSLKDGSKFYGSIRYLCEWTGLTKRAVMLILQKLVKDKIILKEDAMVDLVKRCHYTYNFDGEKITPVVKKLHHYGEKNSLGVVKKLHGGGEKSSPNNINKNINIEDNNREYIDTTYDTTTRYGKFLQWMQKDAPYCYKNMTLPTEKQFNKLLDDYGNKDVIDIIQEIENRKDKRKNYSNLNLTIRSWMKYREKAK